MDLPRQLGAYTLLERIGRGGMGAVYRARKDGAIFAVKTLHPHLADHASAIERFAHEARLARLVDSPYVVRIFDAGKIGDELFIAMELVEGISARALIDHTLAAKRELSIPLVARVVSDVLTGLQAIHDVRDAEGRHLHAVHRDVSPKNVIVGRDGVSRLIDLGIGRSLLKTSKTATGALVGTRGYLAPEQAIGQAIDHRVDLFQAGMLLFELITLRPYQHPISPDRDDVIAAALSNRPAQPSLARPEVSPELDRIVQRAVALDPAERFPTADEFKKALAEARALPATAIELVASIPQPAPPKVDEPTRSAADERSTEAIEAPTEPAPTKKKTTRSPLIAISAISAAAIAAWIFTRPPETEPAPLRNTGAPRARAIAVQPEVTPTPIDEAPPVEAPRPRSNAAAKRTPAKVPEPAPEPEAAETILLRLSKYGSEARARAPDKAAGIERILGEAARVRNDADRLARLERELRALAGD